MTPRKRALYTVGQLALCALSVALAACGSADHPLPDTPDASPEQAEVSSGVNVCPSFQGSLVMPGHVQVGDAAYIVVRASDPDAPDSSLTFAWSAAKGRFSSPDKAQTSYRCETPGVARLTVTATDRQGCESQLTLSVDCVTN